MIGRAATLGTSTRWAVPVLATAVLFSALMVTGGCALEPPVRESLTVGVHRVELEVPPGWHHFDHGRQQRFERGLAQISLTDLGPVTGEGLLREIAYARDLFRRGQLEDARTRLAALRLRSAFPSEQRWKAFLDPWRRVRRGGITERLEVDRAYTEVLAQVAALPTPDLGALATRALAELGHDERRDVARRQAMAVDGRDALLVDTWERLSHASRKRHLFILNEGNLLVARMELGAFDEMEAAFDALVASLAFPTG